MMHFENTSNFMNETSTEKEMNIYEEHSSKNEGRCSEIPPSAMKYLELMNSGEISSSEIRNTSHQPTRKLSNTNGTVSISNGNNIQCSRIAVDLSPTDINYPKDSFDSCHRIDIFPQVNEAKHDITKISDPKQKVPGSNKNNIQSSHSDDNMSSAVANGSLESCHKNDVFHTFGASNYNNIEQSLLNKNVLPRLNKNNNRENNIMLGDDLSLDFASNLTFSDAPEGSERQYDICNNILQNVPSPNYELNEQNCSVRIPVPQSLPSSSPSDLSDSIDETDKMLYSFIRHDPPAALLTEGPKGMFGSNYHKDCLSENSYKVEQNQHFLNKPSPDHPQLSLKNDIGSDPITKEAILPVQHANPHSFIGQGTLTDLPQTIHEMPNNYYLLPCAMPVQNNVDAFRHPHLKQFQSNIYGSHHANIPPGYPLVEHPVQPVSAGLNHCSCSNINIVVPPYETQQLHHQIHVSPYQMSLPQKIIDVAHDTNHQFTEQQGVEQSSKTKLQQEYIRAVNYASHLQQQLFNATQQSQGLQHRPYDVAHPQNNMFCSGMHMPVPSQNGFLATDVTIRPNTAHLSHNTNSGIFNVHPLINTTVASDLIQPITDAAIGRGRGRVQ